MASSIEDNAVRWEIRQGGLPEYQRVSTLACYVDFADGIVNMGNRVYSICKTKGKGG